MTAQEVTQDKLVGQREFARHRGVSLGAVQKAIKSERISAAVELSIDGAGESTFRGIWLAKGMALWDRNTDPVEALKNGQILVAPAEPAAAIPATEAPPGVDLVDQAESPPAPAAVMTASGAEDTGFQAHRAERELYSAKTAKLDYFERAGELTPSAEVRKAAFEAGRQLRERLLNLPDRLSAELAAMTEPVQVHKRLTDELKRVLHELSTGNDAAGGSGISE